MTQLSRSRARRNALWLVAIVGGIGLVVIATATLYAVGVQKELDKRISSLQDELRHFEYITKRSQEFAIKQEMLRAKLGGPATTAGYSRLEPCLAAAAEIPPVPTEVIWNPLTVRRAVRQRQAWRTSAQEVITSARDCEASALSLEQAIESIDRELAQQGPG